MTKNVDYNLFRGSLSFVSEANLVAWTENRSNNAYMNSKPRGRERKQSVDACHHKSRWSVSCPLLSVITEPGRGRRLAAAVFNIHTYCGRRIHLFHSVSLFLVIFVHRQIPTNTGFFSLLVECVACWLVEKISPRWLSIQHHTCSLILVVPYKIIQMSF